MTARTPSLHALHRSPLNFGVVALACLQLLATASGPARAAHGHHPPDAPAPNATTAGHRHVLSKVVMGHGRDVIVDNYIVVFRPGTSASTVKSAEKTAIKQGGEILQTYGTALVGFGAVLPAAALNALNNNPAVDYIEQDQTVYANFTQWSPPTGLDRVSERLLLTSPPLWPTPNYPLDNRYTYDPPQYGPANVWVLDTGILPTHQDLAPRVSLDFTAYTGTATDCNGHGTHVAGIIGGSFAGITKDAKLHSVRVLNCNGQGSTINVIAGVNWVAAHGSSPAVANMSLSRPYSQALNSAVTTTISLGITFTVAAGDYNGASACNRSPASATNAITVAAMNPVNDTVTPISSAGPCVDLYAPGENILSDWYSSNTAQAVMTGTSMASAHAAGVVARYIEDVGTATPAAVWSHLHLWDDDVSGTPGWPGMQNLPANTPNELLHYGTNNTISPGHDDGDPHMITVDGLHYNYQRPRESVALRDGNGTEIQTRTVPVSTQMYPPVDPYDGLAQCVSLNTAVAARVGSHRVSYEPNVNGLPDPSGLQLRIDGTLTTMVPSGVDLAGGGRVAPSPVGVGIEVDFPDGSSMTAIPNYWTTMGLWYLNMEVYNTKANEGLLGSTEPFGWLPGLPNGAYLGAMPSALHDRFVELNSTFSDAWGVTDASSLFDYGAGTSTETFNVQGWPPEAGQCVLSGQTPVPPLDQKTAVKSCKPVKGEPQNGDCVFDVMVTGNTDLAKLAQLSQQVNTQGTKVGLFDNGASVAGDPATFTARVSMLAAGGKHSALTGAVQFNVDGTDVGAPVPLDRTSTAVTQIELQAPGVAQVQARFLPDGKDTLLPSTSLQLAHQVN